MKKCTVCKENKKQEDFYKQKTSNDGFSYRCKTCDDKAVKEYRQKNKESYQKSVRNTNLKQKYNVDLEWYEEAFNNQGRCCSICKITENAVTGERSDWSFAVDHCHITKNIRGILCNKCNRALGMFGDSKELLISATKYLDQFN